jgi:L-lysine 2,3-aminomutase
MISDVTKLQEAGVANPTQLLGKIGDDVGKLSTLFHALIKQGAIPIEVPDNP